MGGHRGHSDHMAQDAIHLAGDSEQFVVDLAANVLMGSLGVRIEQAVAFIYASAIDHHRSPAEIAAYVLTDPN